MSSLNRTYFGRRLAYSAIALAGVIVAVFLLTRVLPGNPAVAKAGTFATEEHIERLEEELGVNKPLPAQFGDYVGGLLQGDLGVSSVTGHPVAEDLRQRIPASLEIALASLLVSIVIGVPLGVVAAMKAGSVWSKLGDGVVVFGIAVPLFWLGLAVIFVFYYLLGVEPAPSGRLDTDVAPPPPVTNSIIVDSILALDMTALRSSLAHLVWPVLVLGLTLAGGTVKMVRSVVGDVLTSDYVRAARALGVSRRVLVGNYILRPSLGPILTLLGIQLGYLLGGNVIIERIFNWPGVGSYAWSALTQTDFFAIQGFILLVGALYITLNLVIDLLHVASDPRVRRMPSGA